MLLAIYMFIRLSILLPRMEGGFLWESGQRGPLLRKQPSSTAVKSTLVASTNSHHGQKRSKERIKVKILSEKNGAGGSTLPESIRCGQCDSSTASLVSALVI